PPRCDLPRDGPHGPLHPGQIFLAYSRFSHLLKRNKTWDTSLPVGVRRSLIEKKDTVAQVRDYVQQTAEKGLKHISFIHPYALPESSDIYATKKDYIDFLDLVAELRDAGKLKVLTLPQLAIAEK
ncbi:hypothetical protein, partial [Corynebacterium tuberculostearicum]|uniref:hypothetical protein n=1 Tax=Corynebacterium tuberculostearicum TaxID=38304 RepID=UPI0020269BCD